VLHGRPQLGCHPRPADPGRAGTGGAGVLDFEVAGLADPEYDLRGFPGPALGPGLELLLAMVRHYERYAGRPVRMDRVMAWHVRTALGDALWHTEARIPLPDHRTPPEWVDDVARRFAELGIGP
jgi:hypothetical protein